MFNFLKNKKGQSLVEYAIIIGMVIVTSFTAISELYDAAKHNFYYGLLPTNSQNVYLPDGPNGEKGWLNSDMVGVPQIECVADTGEPVQIPTATGEIEDITVYLADKDQEIYCVDTSLNSVRNSWGSQYKNVKIGDDGEKELTLSIWDEYGIKHDTKVIIKPLARANAEKNEIPIAVITTQPPVENRTFFETDSISVFGTSSSPIPGGSIDAYEWEFVDIGYEDNKKVTKTYRFHEDRISSSNGLIKYNPDYKYFNFLVTSEEMADINERYENNITELSNMQIGAAPSGTRYLRLRVHSTGCSNTDKCWSDWTQKAIKTGETARPYAVISVYSALDMQEQAEYKQPVVNVRTAESLYLTYVNSVNPETKNDKIDIDLENGKTATTNKGLISYKWFISKFNQTTNKFENEQALGEKNNISSMNTHFTTHINNPDDHIYGFTFNETGQYCVRLAVRNEDGLWSFDGVCDASMTTPDAPNNHSVKYFIVKRGNIPPQLTLTSSPPMVEGKITGTISTDFVFTPNIIHPELSEEDYHIWYQPTDYQFGEYYWELTDPEGNVLNYDQGSHFGDIVVNRLNVSGTYYIKVKISDKTGDWSNTITFPIYVIFPTNYGPPTIEYYQPADQPRIPSGQGTAISLASDDTSKEVDMGFSFLAYGIEFSHVEFSSNGLLTFTKGKRRQDNGTWGATENISDGTTEYTASAMSSNSTPDYSLAAYWTDLYPSIASVEYYIDTDRVIIEYKNHSHFKSKGSSTIISFTVVIYSSGYIDVYYEDVDFNGESYAIGYGKGVSGDSFRQLTVGLKGTDSQTSQYTRNSTTKTIDNYQVIRYTPIE